jgi:protein gp37
MAKTRTTGIEWTEHTWNPFVGCTIHTAGCTNCYAMKQAQRIIEMRTTPVYDGTIKVTGGHPVWTGVVNKASAATMRKPFTVKDPSIFFVNSMSDFFHPAARDEWRIEALGVMASTYHQYQILTKRPEEIAPFLARTDARFPDNAWIGTTVERGEFKHRIDTLRAVPAKIKFLSIEPLIGTFGKGWYDGIDWIIAGGESGPRARPMKPEWLRPVRDDAVTQGVAFFFKQWGTAPNNPIYHEPADPTCRLTGAARVDALDPVGKGGSKIDGREWKQYPRYDSQRTLF